MGIKNDIALPAHTHQAGAMQCRHRIATGDAGASKGGAPENG